MSLSAYNPDLPSDVLLGTGVIVLRPTDPTQGYTILSASEGGVRWDPKREVRNIPFDGKFYDIEGLDWEIGGVPTIEGTFIQYGSRQIPIWEGGATTTTPGAGIVTKLHTPQKAGLLYTAGKYQTNLCAVFQRASGGFCQIRMFKALCLQYTWDGRNKEEGKVAATFVARQPLADSLVDLGTRPYVIEELSAMS